MTTAAVQDDPYDSHQAGLTAFILVSELARTLNEAIQHKQLFTGDFVPTTRVENGKACCDGGAVITIRVEPKPGAKA